jgi:murein DD-endopeptidase MepM/ murein hydrolase activator NlpD
MRLSAIAALMIITTVLLSGCGKSQMAALDDRSHNFYGRNGVASGPQFASNQTYQDVAVAPITASDLPPPTAPLKATATPLATNAAWQWPVQGQVIQKFGAQGNGQGNEGITIAAAEGTPIHAAKAGEVAFIGTNVHDFGNMVILRHANGDMTSYAHARTICVHKGEQIAGGQVVGYVGTSGGAKSPQLHFAVREGDHAVDPLSKLPPQANLTSEQVATR